MRRRPAPRPCKVGAAVTGANGGPAAGHALPACRAAHLALAGDDLHIIRGVGRADRRPPALPAGRALRIGGPVHAQRAAQVQVVLAWLALPLPAGVVWQGMQHPVPLLLRTSCSGSLVRQLVQHAAAPYQAAAAGAAGGRVRRHGRAVGRSARISVGFRV